MKEKVSFLSPDELVERYTGLVRGVAWRLAHRLPLSIEYSDLVQDGMVMLIQLRLEDSFSGQEMSAFVARRVRGAMFDAMRSLDPISRSVRKMARAINASKHRLLQSLDHHPTHGEIAADAHLELRKYFEVLRDIACGEHQDPDETPESADVSANPLEIVLDSEWRMTVNNAVWTLPDRNQEILMARFSLGERMHVTAAAHGVSESRICQIQKAGVDQLRAALREESVA